MLRLCQSLLIVVALGAPSAVLAASGETSPVTVHCAIHGTGGAITVQLNRQVVRDLNRDIRETLKLYNLQCLQKMVKFGGLGQLGISWPDLYEKACKAILDKVASADGPIPPPGQLFSHDRLVAALHEAGKSR